MPVRIGIESVRVNGKVLPAANPIEASVGDVIDIAGWAVDSASGRGASSVAVSLDKHRTYLGRSGIARPELVHKLGDGARDGGFSVTLETAGLRPSAHRLSFVVTSGGQEWTSFHIGLRLASSNGRAEHEPQIVIAAAIKSGNRHVAAVLRRYYGVETPVLSDANDGETLLSEEFLQPLIDRPFIAGLHCLGRAINRNAVAHWGLQVAVTWRNLGDAIVSFDEHICWLVDHSNEVQIAPDVIWRGWPFLDAREGYRLLPDEKRYQFLIRNAIPWYFSFYLSWRIAPQPLMMRYEWMATDPIAYFRYLIERLDGSIDEERLQTVVDAGPTGESGFNVGVKGRSSRLLPEACQEMLEACIREHPSDVGELLYELPWYAEKYAPSIFVSPRSDEVYLVAENTRRRASAHWLRTHMVDPATIVSVAPRDIAGYELGADLF